MHEINIHTQRSDKCENKLGSDNIMKRKRRLEVIFVSDHISNVKLEVYHQLINIQETINNARKKNLLLIYVTFHSFLILMFLITHNELNYNPFECIGFYVIRLLVIVYELTPYIVPLSILVSSFKEMFGNIKRCIGVHYLKSPDANGRESVRMTLIVLIFFV